MTPEDFVVQIRKSIVDENLSAYRNILTCTEVQNARDPHWQRALRLYANMKPDEREVLFDIIRQVMIDTIANMLAY